MDSSTTLYKSTISGDHFYTIDLDLEDKCILTAYYRRRHTEDNKKRRRKIKYKCEEDAQRAYEKMINKKIKAGYITTDATKASKGRQSDNPTSVVVFATPAIVVLDTGEIKFGLNDTDSLLLGCCIISCVLFKENLVLTSKSGTVLTVSTKSKSCLGSSSPAYVSDGRLYVSYTCAMRGILRYPDICMISLDKNLAFVYDFNLYSRSTDDYEARKVLLPDDCAVVTHLVEVDDTHFAAVGRCDAYLIGYGKEENYTLHKNVFPGSVWYAVRLSAKHIVTVGKDYVALVNLASGTSTLCGIPSPPLFLNKGNNNTVYVGISKSIDPLVIFEVRFILK